MVDPKRILSIDIETYSSVDLLRSGVYRYAESQDFEILLLAYAFDDEEVSLVDLAQGEEIPQELVGAIMDPKIIKTAFNANFERVCLARYFKRPMDPKDWRCTSVHSLSLGLPPGLQGVAASLRLAEGKMEEGRFLINFFSKPSREIDPNGCSLRNLPSDDLHKWEIFKAYCKRDVEVERSIRKKLEKFPLGPGEQDLWVLDQKINDYGIRIDQALVRNALISSEAYGQILYEEALDLTRLENPNSPKQLKDWLHERGVQVDTLSKAKVEELLKEVKDERIARVLRLRLDMSKTSIKKYEAMERAVSQDGKIKGLLQFYGASTGRWAGRIINPQNLPRNSMEDLAYARLLLKSGDYKSLESFFGSPPQVLSGLIRTAFIPSEASRFIVADFSSIEARIIAWLAGEDWVVESFRGHGRIYEMVASKIFGVDLERIQKGNPEYEYREKGKLATLACGYQGSVGALKSMGALDMGLKEEDLKPLVDSWRRANPKIVQLWWDVEEAALRAVREGLVVNMQYGLGFTYRKGILFIRLPSGRSLAYVRPRVERDERFNKDKLSFEGMVVKTRKWGRVDTYGGKLVENIVQAIARDCLGVSMLALDEAGYRISFHVHDELILDLPLGMGSRDQVERIMTRDISWAPGLPLAVESFETNYYMKG